MTITRVASQNVGTSVDAGSTASTSFPANITNGNLIVIAIEKFHSGSSTLPVVGDITKSAGTATLGSFNLDRADAFNPSASDWNHTAIYSAKVSGTGSCTIRVGSSTAADAWDIMINEYSTDVGWSATGATRLESFSGTSSAGQTTATTGVMVSAGIGLFVGVVAIDTGVNEAITPGTGWSTIFEQEDGSAHLAGSAIDLISAVATSVSGTWTIGGGTSNRAYVASGAQYKETASGGGGVSQPVLIYGDLNGIGSSGRFFKDPLQ